MQAVIMAGGKGTRLAALTKDEIPKPMVEVAGKPLLLWQVERLKDHGITISSWSSAIWVKRSRNILEMGKRFGVRSGILWRRAPGHCRFLLLFKGHGGGDLLHDVWGPVF